MVGTWFCVFLSQKACAFKNKHFTPWNTYTVEPGYNDTGLCDTASIASDILWYQLIPRC